MPSAPHWPSFARGLIVLAAFALSVPLARADARSGSKIAFIDDDYARALEESRRTGRPLFVDAWAPWCHTCLSLKAYVFSDPALAPLANRFVWAAIDTEKESNAAFVKGHPVDAWPTLFIIDGKTGTARARWLGALTANELKGWLTESTSPGAVPGKRERGAEARVVDLRRGKDHVTCVTEAIKSLRWMAAGTSRLNVGIEGITCAVRLPAGAPQRNESLATLTSATLAIVNDDQIALLDDDRSNGYATLVDAAEATHDGPRAKTLATAWLALLQKAAAAAPDPAARAVFDAHQAQAALALAQPQLAMPALEASARDFPRDYNPPARLARLYLSAGRLTDARAAIDRALALVYGPRRRRIEQLRDEITVAETAKAAKTLPMSN